MAVGRVAAAAAAAAWTPGMAEQPWGFPGSFSAGQSDVGEVQKALTVTHMCVGACGGAPGALKWAGGPAAPGLARWPYYLLWTMPPPSEALLDALEGRAHGGVPMHEAAQALRRWQLIGRTHRRYGAEQLPLYGLDWWC